jgi:multidrug efflux system membrane fusion protein
MNVQIAPLQPSSTQDDDLKEGRGHIRPYLIGGMALALVLGGFWYFTHDSGTPKAKRNLAAPVKVAAVEVRDMAVVEHTIGTVMANSTVQINSRVNGQLTRAFFKEGQMVKTGDPLFEIDPRPYQAAYDNAVASMVTAKAKAERYGRLKAQNAVAGQDYDDAQAAYLEAKANVESARLNLEYTTIRSPVNGKTGPILIQPGNMVSSTSSSSSNSTTNGISTANPLVTINEVQPVKISLALPQSDLPRIQAQMAKPGGLTAAMNMRELGGDDIKVPVNFVSNAVAGLTGTIELRASYPNTDMKLVPGQLVDTTVVLAQIPQATVVPRDAVNTGPDGLFVYVVKDGVAEQRPVRLEFDDGVNDAVDGNLKVGELVVTDGQLRVLPGAKVSISGTRKHASTDTKGLMTSGRRRIRRTSDHEG